MESGVMGQKAPVKTSSVLICPLLYPPPFPILILLVLVVAVVSSSLFVPLHCLRAQTCYEKSSAVVSITYEQICNMNWMSNVQIEQIVTIA